MGLFHVNLFYVFLQTVIEPVAAQRLAVSDYDQFHPGTGDGHIHSSQVTQKTDLSLIVAPNHADKDNVTLLSLETIYGIDTDHLPVWLEKRIFANEMTQHLYLCLVR